MIKVTVKTGKRDKFGDRIANADTVIEAYGFNPAFSSLAVDTNGQQTDRTGALYTQTALPAGIGPSAQLVFSETPGGEEKTWVINGDVSRWSYPWGSWSPGYEIPVRRVTG